MKSDEQRIAAAKEVADAAVTAGLGGDTDLLSALIGDADDPRLVAIFLVGKMAGFLAGTGQRTGQDPAVIWQTARLAEAQGRGQLPALVLEFPDAAADELRALGYTVKPPKARRWLGRP